MDLALSGITNTMLQQASLVANSASTSIAAMGNQVATAMPATIHAGAAQASQFATGVGLVEKPARAMAQAVPLSGVQKVAKFLGKALPIVVIGASAVAGASVVEDRGAIGLVATKKGRGAVLGAVGGSLLLVPTPATQLGAAVLLGASAANEFGAFNRLDARYAG